MDLAGPKMVVYRKETAHSHSVRAQDGRVYREETAHAHSVKIYLSA